MKSEQTTENTFTHIKLHSDETILTKMQNLEKTMIKYSLLYSPTNYVRFSLRCHHNFS